MTKNGMYIVELKGFSVIETILDDVEKPILLKREFILLSENLQLHPNEL